MKNIHVISTDKPSRLYLEDETFKLTEYDYPNVDYAQNQQTYITSDEEIKEGDWVYDSEQNYIRKLMFKWNETDFDKKIILTTDQDLIADGVQAIDDEFLEWFVKNSSCEFVKTELLNVSEVLWEEYFKKHGVYPKYPYYEKIIIPQEEPKQETLKEAAERLHPTTIDSFTDTGIDMSETERLIFISGANWQAEQIHGQDYLQGFIDQFGDGELGELDPKEWDALALLKWLKLNNFEIIKKK
jgi:hypothetical protein